MQLTRWGILEFLQRRGQGSVRELSEALGLTPTGIRQHLALLQRDTLITCNEVRGPVGRPHYIFTLTESGRAVFPRSYDTLAEGLLDEIRASQGSEAVVNLLRKMGSRLASPYKGIMEGKSLAERVAHTTRILQERGNLADWEDSEGEYVLSIYSCPYDRVASKHPEMCQLDQEFIKGLIGSEVQKGDCWLHGNLRCAYLVKK